MRLARILAAVSLVAAIAVPCLGQVQQIRAVKVEQPPKLDGNLDDACWQRPADAADFFCSETGARAPEKTEAWLTYDAKNIYAAFRCADSQPDKIAAQQMKRGGSIRTDDFVGFDIDPWHSHRTTYYFDVTPRGTQVEWLPGAGGSKIEWLGDWYAAAKTDGSGWTAEMAIPWSILKYPKGQNTMGIYFVRRHARSSIWWLSPYMGAGEDEALALDWVGVEPPEPKLHGIGLHYTNVGVGGVRFKNGLDIKRQLSQETNGLLTINPDFESIEQDVESIDFTYSPRVLSDKRPFFAEGGDQHQDGEFRMFYSRDIENVDVGAKIAGQTAAQDFSGLLTTAGRGDRHFFYKSRWELGRANRAGLAVTSTREPGVENDVASFYGRLGKRTEKRHDLCEYRLMKSFTPGSGGDGTILVTGAGGHGGPRQVGWGMWYQDVKPDYFAADGIVPDPDLKGWDYYLSYHDEYAEGRIRGWWVSMNGIAQHIHAGDLLNRGLSFSASGWSANAQAYLGFSRSARRQESLAGDGTFVVYDDRAYLLGYAWNQNDMYSRGSIDLRFGRQAGGRSVHAQIRQGIKLRRDFHSDLSVEFVRMTGPYARRERQSVASVSYDISSERSISGRIIERDGTFNLTFGFRQAVRRGQDIYLLFGDPNADKTKNRVILKLIRPLF